MAKSKVTAKGGGRVTRRRGRSVVALTLFGFVLVATSVIWRRTFGLSQSRMVQQLERQKSNLRAQRTQLQQEIRDAASRDKLKSVVEQRLRLRMPSDSQVIVIERKEALAKRGIASPDYADALMLTYVDPPEGPTVAMFLTKRHR